MTICGVDECSKEKKGDDEDDQPPRTSPFLKYDDPEHPYVWPNLYDELDGMFDACCLIYAMAELRQKTRQGEIDDPTLLHLPLTPQELWKVVRSTQHHLKDTKFGQAFYIELIKLLAKRHQKKVAWTEDSTSRSLQAQLVAFNDCNYQEESVYGIAVNPTLKRITICFRGSISKMDWAMDLQIFMTSVDNPVPESKDQAGPKLRIHNGFYKYLFAPQSQLKKEAQAKNRELVLEQPGAEDTDLSQYQEMMQLYILPLVKEYPGFKIYVTGHSLGASLATVYAFFLAAEPDDVIPKPVTCISFGSPFVGDESFRLAHRALEGLGKLRNLRVSNHKDLVTLVPNIALRAKFWDSDSHVGTLFKHVGLNIRFFPSKSSATPYQFLYPKIRGEPLSSTLDELKRAWDYSLLANLSLNWSVYHSVTEYEGRIDDNMASLQTMYLNDLYADREIVGRLITDY